MSQISFAVLGLGSRTTDYYLSELNRHYNLINGGYSTCPFLLLNTDFNTINSLLPDPSEELDAIVKNSINEIEKLNTPFILIPNITLHETIDRVEVNANVIHPIHLSISNLKENNWNKVVLFGSLHSMKSDYITAHFNANGIEVILPSEEDMLLIDEVRKAIYNHTETTKLIANYHSVINKYSTLSPVVLGCTELSILKPKEFNNNLLDMAQLQIESAINSIN